MRSCLYFGKVTHRRLRPVQHQLAYDVACVFMDVDTIASETRGLRFLSYNRWNMFSIHDKSFGQDAGEPLAQYLWRVVQDTPGAARVIKKIFVLCYPSVLGYVFNPLTSYYGVDENGHIRLMIYEVSNTFGGRHSYITKIFAPNEACHTTADKVLLVSPFNLVEGHYGLTASQPAETLALGVSLTTVDGPIMKAYFAAKRAPLNDWQLLKIFIALPFMTLKIMAGIHWEALKLWVKGLRPKQPRRT